MLDKMVDRGRTSELTDCLDNLEEEFRSEQAAEGYKTGFELGKKAGLEEGNSQGLIEGAKVGSEVGFYRGYTMTWINLLKLDADNQIKSKKMLSKLNEVLEIAENFPKTNETICEQKLSSIRVKFKQSTSLLDLKI